MILQWGSVNVNYNQTNTLVNLSISFSVYFHTMCMMSKPAYNGVCTAVVVRANNTLSTFTVYGDHTQSTILDNPTSYLSIGF